MPLTKSDIGYIKVIYELSCTGEGAHINDIAARLKVTKASASLAVKKLQGETFLQRDVHRLVFLTKTGEKEALHFLDRFEIIQCFLKEVLHVGEQTANDDAKAIENLLSIDSVCALCKRTAQETRKNRCADKCHIHRNSTDAETSEELDPV
ncbi:MAG: metal-dependent transcriptional regulator [Oscillospiraceae bacterium]